MQKKITIIGAGSVGATTAFALLTRGAASEVVLIDINTEKALGEALDIKQATPFIDNCDIYAGSYRDAVGSDVVIITSGIGRRPGQTRLELVQTNVGIIKSISEEIVKYAPNAIYILVANPVDILTYAFLKYTGLPKHQVMGTGTALIHAKKEGERHSIKYLGGTGMGGGTLLGLTRKMVGVDTVEHIEQLCSGGDLDNIDLRIKDISRTQGYHGIKARRATVIGIRYGAFGLISMEPLPHAAHLSSIGLIACQRQDIALVVLILRDNQVKVGEIRTAEGTRTVATIGVACALQ